MGVGTATGGGLYLYAAAKIGRAENHSGASTAVEYSPPVSGASSEASPGVISLPIVMWRALPDDKQHPAAVASNLDTAVDVADDRAPHNPTVFFV